MAKLEFDKLDFRENNQLQREILLNIKLTLNIARGYGWGVLGGNVAERSEWL